MFCPVHLQSMTYWNRPSSTSNSRFLWRVAFVSLLVFTAGPTSHHPKRKRTLVRCAKAVGLEGNYVGGKIDENASSHPFTHERTNKSAVPSTILPCYLCYVGANSYHEFRTTRCIKG